jgi:hypothetical protein
MHLIMFGVTQRVGSSGKGIGLCGSPMRSKVRIPLGTNNSFGLAPQRSRNIIRSVWRGHFTWLRGLPKCGGYTKCPTLEGFLVIKKKKKIMFGAGAS